MKLHFDWSCSSDIIDEKLREALKHASDGNIILEEAVYNREEDEDGAVYILREFAEAFEKAADRLEKEVE